VAITSPAAGAVAERLDTTLVVSGTFSDATSIEVFSGATSWGAATLGAGTWTLTRTLQLTDVTETAVLKATATGNGTTDSATVTIAVRAKEADYGTLIGSWLLTRNVTLNGSDVAQINDQSGNARHLTADAGKQPAYSATAWNGAEPACDFDGVAEYAVANGVAVALSGTDVAFTAVMTVELLANANAKMLMAAARNNAAGNGSIRVNTGSASNALTVRHTDDAAASDADTTTETLGTTRHVISIVYTGTAVSVWFDGTATSLAATAQDVGASTLVRFGVGALVYGVAETAAAFCNMRLASLHIYNAALDDTNRAAVRTLQKLRFSGLP